MKTFKTIVVVVLIILAIFFGFRLLSPEDTWICDDGIWQKHGNPSTPMPTTACVITPTK